MKIIKSIKAPKFFQKKEDKTYSLTPLGQCKMEWDIKKEKERKINGVVSIAVILGMFAAGFLSKEFFVMIMAGKGIGKFAGWMIG